MWHERLGRLLHHLIKVGLYSLLFIPILHIQSLSAAASVSKTFFFWLVVEVLTVLYLLLICVAPRFRPRRTALLWTVTAYVLALFLTSFFGVDFYRSFWSDPVRLTGLVSFLHYWAFFIILSSVVQKREEWRYLITVSIGVSVFLALLALSLKVSPMGGPRFSEGATIGNSTFLAVYLMIHVFFVFYLYAVWRREKPRWVRLSLIGSVIILLAALLLSQAYAPIISFFGGLILLPIVWFIARGRGRLRLIGIVFLIALMLTTLFLIYLALRPGNTVNNLLIGYFTKARPVVWQVTWEGIKERPILGWGQEHFKVPFFKHINSCVYVRECGSEFVFDRAHNVVLDNLATSGIVGLFTYLSLFGVALWTLWTRYKRRLLDVYQPVFVTVILAAYFVQNLTSFDLIITHFFFFFILAWIHAHDELPVEGRAITSRVVLGLFSLLLAIGLIFSLRETIVRPLKVYLTLQRFYRSVTPAERLSILKEAERMPTHRQSQWQQFADVTKSTVTDPRVKLAPFDEEMRLVIGQLKAHLAREPQDFPYYMILTRLSNTYARAHPDQVEEALTIAKTGLALSPTNVYAQLAVAETLVITKHYEEALVYVERAVELAPTLEVSHLNAIELAKRINSELAREKVRRAAEALPELAATFHELVD